MKDECKYSNKNRTTLDFAFDNVSLRERKKNPSIFVCFEKNYLYVSDYYIVLYSSPQLSSSPNFFLIKTGLMRGICRK